MTDEANQPGAETARRPPHFLKEWRERRELSQRELAALLHVSHSRISRLEADESELRPRFLGKLALFFNIPPTALLTVNPQGEGRQTADMLDVWARIDPKKRDDALRVLRAFERPDDASEIG